MRSLVNIIGIVLGVSALGILGYGAFETFRKGIWDPVDYLIVAMSFAMLSQILLTLAKK